MRHAKLVAALVCGGLWIALSGCVHGASVTIGSEGPQAHAGHSGHGPPPHAPAHGHRRKHHGPDRDVELVFDADLGVYVVVDLPDLYFWDGFYLRIDDGRWYASVRLDGRWEPRSADSLPPGLARKAAKRKKHKSHGPAKGRW